MRKALIWLSAAALVLVPALARAQSVGQITSISVTPSPAAPGETVSITVNVVGLGCAFTLNFGDNTSVTTDTAHNPITHVYKQSANLTASSAPIFPCSGLATATLPVLNLPPKVRDLNCIVKGCNPTIASMPFSQVHPGGQVLFVGKGFGLAFGTASMVLQPEGGTLNTIIPLTIPTGWWTPNWVSATIPQNLSGYVPQTATFQIVTADGAASNAFLVPFAPQLEVQDAPSLLINCSMTASSPSDICQTLNGNSNWPVECPYDPVLPWYYPPQVGYAAGHASGWQIWAGSNDTGTDTFSFGGPLLYGWQTAGYNFSYWSLTGGSFAEFLNWPTPGATSNPPPWSVLWSVSACDFVVYEGDYWIAGPLGTPPQ